MCKEKIERAEALMDGLNIECKRWVEESGKLQEEVTFVLGDAILFSSLANLFLGIPEGLHYMKEILNTRGVAYTSDTFWSRMVEKEAVKMWAAAGLEEINGAAICFVSEDLWPLMVDPDCLMERGISEMIFEPIPVLIP